MGTHTHSLLLSRVLCVINVFNGFYQIADVFNPEVVELKAYQDRMLAFNCAYKCPDDYLASQISDPRHCPLR